jgi:DNA-binding helix-hairpin-helix protein with protein kinase domain
MPPRHSYLFESNSAPVPLGRRLGSGGEGDVFDVSGKDMVVKILRDPTSEFEEKVRAMVKAPPKPPGVLPLGFSYAWPTDLVTRGGSAGRTGRGRRVVGFAMKRAHYRYTLAQLVRPKSRGPEVDRRFLLRVAKHAALGLSHLHQMGVLVGDLNETNTVIGATGSVTFLDADSFQVRANGRVYRCNVGKAEFTARELFGRKYEEQDRTPESDSFALAVALWLILMDGNHPFASKYTGTGTGLALKERIEQGVWAYARRRPRDYVPRPMAPPFDSLPRPLQNLFRDAFEAGHADPSARPTPAKWVLALAEWEKSQRTASPSAPTFMERASAVFDVFVTRLKDLGRRLPALRLPSVSVPPSVRTWAGRSLVAAGASVLTLAALAATRTPNDSPPKTTPDAVQSSTSPHVGSRGAGERTPRLWEELRRKEPSAPKSP